MVEDTIPCLVVMQDEQRRGIVMQADTLRALGDTFLGTEWGTLSDG
jgi:hypothetical protein